MNDQITDDDRRGLAHDDAGRPAWMETGLDCLVSIAFLVWGLFILALFLQLLRAI